MLALPFLTRVWGKVYPEGGEADARPKETARIKETTAKRGKHRQAKRLRGQGLDRIQRSQTNHDKRTGKYRTNMTTYENPREFKGGIFMPNFKETEVNGIWKRQRSACRNCRHRWGFPFRKRMSLQGHRAFRQSESERESSFPSMPTRNGSMKHLIRNNRGTITLGRR